MDNFNNNAQKMKNKFSFNTPRGLNYGNNLQINIQNQISPKNSENNLRNIVFNEKIKNNYISNNKIRDKSKNKPKKQLPVLESNIN